MWYKDIRHGEGKLTYENGNMIKGTWDKDRLNGPGEIHNVGKSRVDCIFKDDLVI